VTARSPFVFLEHVQIRSQESWQQQPGSRAAELPIVVGLQAANYLASRSGR